jgi:hypothetical protein
VGFVRNHIAQQMAASSQGAIIQDFQSYMTGTLMVLALEPVQYSMCTSSLYKKYIRTGF